MLGLKLNHVSKRDPRANNEYFGYGQMRDNVMLQRRLSLTEPIPRIFPGQ